MTPVSRAFRASALAALILLVAAPHAYGYLDPGTAGIIVQSVLAVIAGILVAARAWWKQIVGLTRRLFTVLGIPAAEADGERHTEDETGAKK